MQMFPVITARQRISLHSAIAFLFLLLPACGPAAFGAGKPPAPTRTRHHYRGIPNYADPTEGDVAAQDDPVIREAAVEALGHSNGSVLAMDPNNGRILTVVNQKMAFSSGFEPCSTIKPVIALAGLQESVITRDTMLRIGYRRYMDLTEALAHSNNSFFEEVGLRLGFDRVVHYAALLGLGEASGYGIPEEHPGTLPSHPPSNGGVAHMSSYGGGIRVTPLQLAALVSAFANGGTLYYLQYPRTDEERQNFSPRIKRQLDIKPLLPAIQEGMLAAVLYGTARDSYDPDGEQALGKTGTCSDESVGGHVGWYASYADEAHPKIVLVVLLRGRSRHINGPHAADVAGHIYRSLREEKYFAGDQPAVHDAVSIKPRF